MSELYKRTINTDVMVERRHPLKGIRITLFNLLSITRFKTVSW